MRYEISYVPNNSEERKIEEYTDLRQTIYRALEVNDCYITIYDNRNNLKADFKKVWPKEKK